MHEFKIVDEQAKVILLTENEIKLLNEFFSNQYISYENIPLLELIRKISAIANE